MAKIPVERKGGGFPWWAWLLIILAILLVIWLLWSLFANNTAPATTGAVVPVVGETATIAPTANMAPAATEEIPTAAANAIVTVEVPTSLSETAVAPAGGATAVPVGGTTVVPGATAPAAVAGGATAVPVGGTTVVPGATAPAAVAGGATAIPGAAVGAGAATAAPTGGATAVPGVVSTPITTVIDIISLQDPTLLVNQAVQLQNVFVQRVTGDVTFFVGPTVDQELLVVLDQQPTPRTPTEGQVDVNPGQTVNLIGTIQPMPSIQEMQQQWNITADQAAAYSKRPIYLFAKDVTVLSQ